MITITTPSSAGFEPGQFIYVAGLGAPQNWLKRLVWRFGKTVERWGQRMQWIASRQKHVVAAVTSYTITLGEKEGPRQ